MPAPPVGKATLSTDTASMSFKRWASCGARSPLLCAILDTYFQVLAKNICLQKM